MHAAHRPANRLKYFVARQPLEKWTIRQLFVWREGTQFNDFQSFKSELFRLKSKLGTLWVSAPSETKFTPASP
jgi:hypothetical protein